MSVRVMSWVWEHSRAEGTDRLVLLAIADCAGDDGGNAWPSIKTLAEKAKVSERTVQRSIRALTLLGEISIEENAGRRGTNVYTIRMGRHVDTPDNLTPPTDSHPRQIDGVTPMTRGGDTGVTRTVKEPSTTPQPPAASGEGRGPQKKPDHCGKHSRHRNGCDNCASALAESKAKPPWCGDCDERTRLIEPEEGPVHRCPNCHPLRAAS